MLIVFIIIVSYIHTVYTFPSILTCILESAVRYEFLYLGIFSQYLLVVPCVLPTIHTTAMSSRVHIKYGQHKHKNSDVISPLGEDKANG